jgi:hypothetical protein
VTDAYGVRCFATSVTASNGNRFRFFSNQQARGDAMTTTGIAAGILSDTDQRRRLRRAVVASAIGTTIEWYDFFI